jgi:hypothetical protein
MCSRFLGHNELLSKKDESPWNRLLLKLIFESVTIVRVAGTQELTTTDATGRVDKVKVPLLNMERVDDEDRLKGKVSGVPLSQEYIDSAACSLEEATNKGQQGLFQCVLAMLEHRKVVEEVTFEERPKYGAINTLMVMTSESTDA